MSVFALKKILGSSLAVAALVIFAGCGGSSPTVPTVPGLGGMSDDSLKAAAGIYNKLGGSAGVTELSSAWGAKMSLNPNITKFLDAASIDAVESGLTNTLATLGGQTVPASSANLLGALKGKGLDQTAYDAMAHTLVDTGREKGLEDSQVAALESMVGSVSNELQK